MSTPLKYNSQRNYNSDLQYNSIIIGVSVFVPMAVSDSQGGALTLSTVVNTSVVSPVATASANTVVPSVVSGISVTISIVEAAATSEVIPPTVIASIVIHAATIAPPADADAEANVPSLIVPVSTGYIIQRRVNDGEWEPLVEITVGGVGELQTPLTLTGQLDAENEKIIIEGS